MNTQSLVSFASILRNKEPEQFGGRNMADERVGDDDWRSASGEKATEHCTTMTAFLSVSATLTNTSMDTATPFLPALQ
jgi:hypothetical protein